MFTGDFRGVGLSGSLGKAKAGKVSICGIQGHPTFLYSILPHLEAKDMSTKEHIENIFQQRKNIYFFIHTIPSNNGTPPSPSTQDMTASLASVTSPHSFLQNHKTVLRTSLVKSTGGVGGGGGQLQRLAGGIGWSCSSLATTFLPSACDKTVTPPFTRL